MQDAGLSSLSAGLSATDEDDEIAAAIAASLVTAKRHCPTAQLASGSNNTHTTHPPSTSATESAGGGVNKSVETASLSAKLGEVLAVLDTKSGTLLMPEPEVGPGVCELSVRLPNSGQCQRRFALTVQLADVWGWLRSLGHDMNQHQLCLAFPRKVLSDGTLTLSEAGVSRRERLILESCKLRFL